jgi:TolA-binding protein
MNIMSKTLAFMLAFFVATAVAHNGEDPKRKLQRDSQRIASMQEEFEILQDDQSRIDNLEKQIDRLRGNALVVRNMLAREYPHVKESMTKLEIDYLAVHEEQVKLMGRMLKQARLLVED